MTSCSRRTSTWSCSWATSTGALAGPRSEAATWPSWLRTSSVWWDPQALTCSAVTLLGRPVSIRAARRRMLRQVTSLRCPCAQVSEAVREVRGVGPDAVLRLGALCGAGAVAGGDGSGARHLRARHRAAPAGHARGAGACIAAAVGFQSSSPGPPASLSTKSKHRHCLVPDWDAETQQCRRMANAPCTSVSSAMPAVLH